MPRPAGEETLTGAEPKRALWAKKRGGIREAAGRLRPWKSKIYRPVPGDWQSQFTGVKPSESRNLRAMEGGRRPTKDVQIEDLPACTLAPPQAWARATQALRGFVLELWNVPFSERQPPQRSPNRNAGAPWGPDAVGEHARQTQHSARTAAFLREEEVWRGSPQFELGALLRLGRPRPRLRRREGTARQTFGLLGLSRPAASLFYAHRLRLRLAAGYSPANLWFARA